MKKAIEQRKSVRNYTGTAITATDEALIQSYISNPANLTGEIFGNKIKIFLNKVNDQKSGKIGTYGVIKNAPAFLVAVCENTKEALLDCGYVFEKLVLYIESIGLNTCWLGGTFNRNEIDVQGVIRSDEMIPVISPVGYGANKRSLVDKVFRKFANSDERKDFDLLFFSEDFNHKVDDDSVREVLEKVRLAPSASNQQPWRVVMGADGTAHFFIERTPNYAKGKLSYDIQILDIGIAISHYEVMMGLLTYFYKDPEIGMKHGGIRYIVSAKGQLLH